MLDLLQKEMVFVDLETTGFLNEADKIIEVGILKVKNGEIIETFNSLVNPGIAVNDDVTRVTGITNNDLIDAPRFKDIKDKVYSLVHGTTFFAHNAQFDYGFLELEFLRHEIPFSAPQVCTVKLSQFLYPAYQRHNLDAISARFGISVEKRHRAFDDAKVIWEFFKIVTKNFDEYTLKLAFDSVLKPGRVVKSANDSQISLF